MNHILDVLLSYLLLYKYITLFIVLFLSSFALPLPSNTLLLAAGAFIVQGYMGLWTTLIIGIAGDVMGDFSMYLLTKKYGRTFFERFKISRSPYVLSLEKYVRNYAGITIVTTRFLTTFGPLVNFLAPLSEISFIRFALYDILGNGINVTLILFAGYLLGNEWQDIVGILSTTGGIVIVVIAIIAIVAITINVRRKQN